MIIRSTAGAGLCCCRVIEIQLLAGALLQGSFPGAAFAWKSFEFLSSSVM